MERKKLNLKIMKNNTNIPFYFKKNSFRKKKLVLAFAVLLLMFIAIEIGLHVAHSIIYFGDKKETGYEQYFSLSPYRDKKWTKTLFKEHHERPRGYEQFVEWGTKEYDGEYVNIDSKGARKTWNPEQLYGKATKSIYVLGGSTIWGVGARDNYTIPSHLSKILNDKYDFMVSNYAENGYTFTQEIIQLVLLLKEGHRPDYVIFYDGANEVYCTYRAGFAGAVWKNKEMTRKLECKELSSIQHILVGTRDMFVMNCMTFRILKKVASVLRATSDTSSRYTKKEAGILAEDVGKNYLASIKLLEHLALAYNFKYICFWQPVIFLEEKLTEEESKVEPLLKDETLFNMYRQTNDYLMANSPPHFFNISNVLSGREESYYIDFAHISEEGNKIVASEMARVFEKEILLYE